MELKNWKGNVLLLFKQTHLKYPELLHTLYAKRQNKNLTTKNPELIIGVCGCMVQQEHIVSTILSTYQQVDLLFGTHRILSNDIEFKDIFRVILKELFAALVLGVTIGAVCFGEIMLIDNLYDSIDIITATVISVVCAISLIMAKLVGCILPLVAKKIKLDPAVVASPLMTTIVDALALVIYCSIAIAVL